MALRANIRGLQERSREPGLSVLPFLKTVLIFIITPLEETRVLNHGVLDVWITLEALVSVVVVARDTLARVILLTSIAAVVFLPASKMLIGGTEALSVARTLAALVFVLTVTAVVARAVFSPGRVSTHRVQGGMLIYLNIALGFALVFASLDGSIDRAFANNGLGRDFSAMMYFSMTTLTTTGYGDMVPLHPLVRSLANLEAAIGQLFPATLLAGLIGAHLIDRGK